MSFYLSISSVVATALVIVVIVVVVDDDDDVVGLLISGMFCFVLFCFVRCWKIMGSDGVRECHSVLVCLRLIDSLSRVLSVPCRFLRTVVCMLSRPPFAPFTDVRHVSKS